MDQDQQSWRWYRPFCAQHRDSAARLPWRSGVVVSAPLWFGFHFLLRTRPEGALSPARLLRSRSPARAAWSRRCPCAAQVGMRCVSDAERWAP